MSKISNAVKKDVAKTTVFDELVKSVNAIQTNGIIYFVKNAERDTKNKDIERNILDHASYITTTEFNKLYGKTFEKN